MTEQQIPEAAPADPTAPAPADPTAPAPAEQAAPNVEPSWPDPEAHDTAPGEEPQKAADDNDPLADGGLATIILTDPDGFETEVPCLVFDTFEHDDAEGESSVHAHVVVLPPQTVVRRDRLTPLR